MSKKTKSDYVDDDVGAAKGFVDGFSKDFDDDDDEATFDPVEYALCSCCGTEGLLLGRVYIELNDDYKIEAEDVCLDCITDRINEYMQGETESDC